MRDPLSTRAARAARKSRSAQPTASSTLSAPATARPLGSARGSSDSPAHKGTPQRVRRRIRLPCPPCGAALPTAPARRLRPSVPGAHSGGSPRRARTGLARAHSHTRHWNSVHTWHAPTTLAVLGACSQVRPQRRTAPAPTASSQMTKTEYPIVSRAPSYKSRFIVGRNLATASLMTAFDGSSMAGL